MPNSQPIDVAIVGGGPAGCAAALTLSARAPELRITVFEASDFQGPRLGETLPPMARTMLRQLGLLGSFERFCQGGGARRVYGTNIVWGQPQAHHEPYLTHARGDGWHLDRRHFDAWLARACSQRGVEIRLLTKVRGLRRLGDSRWHLDLETGPSRQEGSVEARWVIDAAGRAAPLGRRLGARTETIDRLVAFARFFVGNAGKHSTGKHSTGKHSTGKHSTGEATLTVEAVENGWWYSAGLPGDRLVTVALSDADLAKDQGLHEDDGWLRALQSTELSRRRVESLGSPGPLIIRSAASRRRSPAAGPGWITAGDSASVFDPLSSQGLTKSLRSGIFAAYATCDSLLKESSRGLARYNRFITDEFESYLETRSDVYASEQRWLHSPFWSRRT